ncbi:MAG: VWA domain-containing protein, partial [Planctomycetota bacterium]
ARVEASAAEALEAITGQGLGYDAKTWRTWWAEEGVATLTPEPTDPHAETVTVAPPGEIPEPEPHVTRSLIPAFYGLNLTAKDIVFILDISGSVGPGGVGRAKRELIQAVERLGSDVFISAVFFDEKMHMWKPRLVPATPAHKAELAFFLRGIEPGSRTDVFTPLNAGLQLVRDRVAMKEAAGEPFREAVTMIVVSDGVETAGGTPPHVVEEKLDRLDATHTVVHAVTLGGKGSPLMAELARRGGGHYLVIP